MCCGICQSGAGHDRRSPHPHFRNGRNQAIRIPRELVLPGDEAIIRREGAGLIIEPVSATSLRELLAHWPPLDVEFPDIGDLPAESVEL